MEDRRVYTRIHVKIQVKFLDLGSGKEGEAETLDISANGVGFVTKENLSTNTALDMWLIIPDNHEPLYTRGEVVWAKPSEDGQQQRVGVRLVKEDFIGLSRTLKFGQQS